MTALIFHKNYYLLHQYLYYTSQRTHTLLLPCFICDLKEPEGQGMGWVEAVLVLVVLQSVTTSLPHWADAGDLLSPLISTYSHVFKISGLMDAFHFYSLISLQSVFIGDIFFNEICNNSVECGKGSCQVSTDDSLGFVCKCNPGWSQFHIGDYFRKTYTEFVTITDKLSTVSGSLGGDCANLGITLSNSSSSSPPSLSDNGSSSSDTIGPKNLLMVMLVIGLIFVRTR
ncbi:EGF [Musa troglodytarum]|uniref:EGF n=1 Tax=Musa troglodytarum TaxID=320322 RepID=A0A9E7GZE0_9LILI|nr:EGF [Musa troglodytarum]